jgi:glycosyltransferase AglD
MAGELDILIDISLVIPVYNESSILEKSVRRTIGAVRKISSRYEIIIAEDGSTDGTDRIANELAKKYSSVRHLHSERRLGRGGALKNAFKQSRGEVIVYMDADLATDLRHLKTLYESIKTQGYDLATGSRMLEGSMVDRSVIRKMSSDSYNFLVRAILGSKIKDHQCGFKAFRRRAVLSLLDDVKAKHWFWDTEILVRAGIRGYKIKEIPIVWKSSRNTKVNIIVDSISMGWQVISLWRQLHLS